MPRIVVLRVLVVLVAVIFIGRLYQVQVVNYDSQRFGADVVASTRRYFTVPPRRGEIFAADGQTLLAESVPIYNLAVIPGRLPSQTGDPERRAAVLARLGQVAGLTSTLTLSPTTVLAERPALWESLRALQAAPVADGLVMRLVVPPGEGLHALELSQAHRDVLRWSSPIEELIARPDLRSYQGVVIKEDIGVELALAIRENSNYLPGAHVVEDYRRRYPLSGTIPSLSHLLGYTGRINACELVSVNPASSWLTAMVDVLGNAGRCGLIPKQIDPPSIGFPPYQVDDRIGKDGLEVIYESVLRGRAGVESLLVDAWQRPVGPVETVRPVEHGLNLVLSIDARYQAEVERILRRWIAEGERRRQNAREAYKREYDPIFAGAAVVLDPRDGRVLAMASLPAYDNNVWVDPTRRDELLSLLTRSDPQELAELMRRAPLTNRAIAGQYPPGSTLKPFVGAIALHHGVITPDTRLRDPGVLRLIERGGTLFELPNSIRRDNGLLTVRDGLRLSSNVFFASVAGGNELATNLEAHALRISGLGIDRLVEGLSWFHLGRATGIDLAGEASGLVPTKTWKAQVKREVWTTGDTYNTAIGQGDMLVTPLQLAAAAGGIVTDGTIYRPHVVAAITDGSGAVVKEIEPEVIARVPVDPAFLAVIREGMYESVTNGLNIAAREECSGLQIAGKTGTAEFGPLIRHPDGRLVRQSHAWFVGFAPYDHPQVVAVVVLEGVGDLNDGSSTMAVPAVTQMLQAFFGVEPPADRPPICPVMPPDPEPDTPPAEGEGA